MLHAVIMAGGSGTRFWPASRAATPKQLLNLVGERSMIQATVDRLGSLVPPSGTLIVTNRRLVESIAKQLPHLPAGAVLGEPCKRDTAPCIGLAAIAVSRDDPDATMAVMPADHVISPDEVFQKSLTAAAALVDQQPERIVTFGIPPTYPAESFGYIERGEPLTENGGEPVFRVARFREKPDAATAQQYLDADSYYWNSGIFLWKAKTILDALAEHQPKMFARLQTIAAAWGADEFADVFDREFTAIEGISIDYAVMEHATDIVVVPAPFDWDDLGSWRSLARLRGTDAQGNTLAGRCLALDTTGTIVRTTEDHLVATIGLKDCVVVHTPNATLVAAKEDEERVREIVGQLAEQEWEEFL
jgi:mannose-1-phosphate guanylyltransferase